MDLVSLAVGLAVSAADTVTSLHKLGRKWPDCPHSIHELSDDLERASLFLYVPKLLHAVSRVTPRSPRF